MSTDYNGYTNYPTWSVALYIDNEQSLYQEPERIALECAEEVREGNGNPFADSFEAKVRILFVDQLKAWAEETMLGEEDGIQGVNGIAADMFEYAWRQVDWHDLARHYMQDIDFDAITEEQ